MKIYGLLNSNTQLILESNEKITSSQYIEMRYARPSLLHVATATGEWVKEINAINTNERIMGVNKKALKIHTDDDLDLLPNGFTGLVDLTHHPNHNISSLGVVSAHVISGEKIKDDFPRYGTNRVIHVCSYTSDTDYIAHGTILYKLMLCYDYKDDNEVYARTSDFKPYRNDDNTFSSINLPHNKRIIEGTIWVPFVNGFYIYTLPLPFKDDNYTIIFTDTGDGCYSVASMPLNNQQVHMWTRNVYDGSQPTTEVTKIRCKYIGIGCY